MGKPRVSEPIEVTVPLEPRLHAFLEELIRLNLPLETYEGFIIEENRIVLHVRKVRG
jgi:hypothetical protein